MHYGLKDKVNQSIESILRKARVDAKKNNSTDTQHEEILGGLVVSKFGIKSQAVTSV